jgi:hypothetical protein
MITDFIENAEVLERAMKASRLSWSTEHLSTPEKDAKLSAKLIKLGPDHSAALRQAPFWFHLEASRAFWQEFSKYRIGVEMYSESTMHTINRRPLCKADFCGEIGDEQLNLLNNLIATKDTTAIKCALPESFLQRRAIMMNYQSARSICQQRWDHKWPEWRTFLVELLGLVRYPEFIREVEK